MVQSSGQGRSAIIDYQLRHAVAIHVIEAELRLGIRPPEKRYTVNCKIFLPAHPGVVVPADGELVQHEELIDLVPGIGGGSGHGRVKCGICFIRSGRRGGAFPDGAFLLYSGGGIASTDGCRLWLFPLERVERWDKPDAQRRDQREENEAESDPEGNSAAPAPLGLLLAGLRPSLCFWHTRLWLGLRESKRIFRTVQQTAAPAAPFGVVPDISFTIRTNHAASSVAPISRCFPSAVSAGRRRLLRISLCTA